MLRAMQQSVIEIEVEHVYRERNRTADRLATHAIRTCTSSGWVLPEI